MGSSVDLNPTRLGTAGNLGNVGVVLSSGIKGKQFDLTTPAVAPSA